MNSLFLGNSTYLVWLHIILPWSPYTEWRSRVQNLQVSKITCIGTRHDFPSTRRGCPGTRHSFLGPSTSKITEGHDGYCFWEMTPACFSRYLACFFGQPWFWYPMVWVSQPWFGNLGVLFSILRVISSVPGVIFSVSAYISRYSAWFPRHPESLSRSRRHFLGLGIRFSVLDVISSATGVIFSDSA